MRANLFTHVLNQLRGGGAAAELDETLAQLCGACEETQAPGTLVLTLKVKTNGHGQFVIADDVKVKAPALLKGQTLLFQDGEGNLTREDPRQQKMELRVLPNPATIELRTLHSDDLESAA